MKYCVTGNVLGRSLLFTTMGLFFCSCAGMPKLQPRIESLVMVGQTTQAVDLISAKEADYGKGNYLLYYLDRGMLEQMSGRYDDSIQSFGKAKIRFNELYTKALSAEASSWLLNDYSLPYRGPEYEYVLINVFQALNYVAKGDVNEALVEARDLDAKFRVIEQGAQVSRNRRLEDNGFARFLMGLLYEANDIRGTRPGHTDLNDAWIAYRQALSVYEGFYQGGYVPSLLKDELLSAAAYFNDPGLPELRRKFPGITPLTQARKQKTARVYLIILQGFSPVKEQIMLPIPLEEGLVASMAFPNFVRRPSRAAGARLSAMAEGASASWSVQAELGMDIEELAERDLAGRRALLTTKGILRPALKYLIERKQRENIAKKMGPTAAGLFTLAAGLFNVLSEQADLRSWQALPARINIARLVLNPGHYYLSCDDLDAAGGVLNRVDLGAADLQPGEVRFIIRRSGP